jgi:hypothetical protein
MIKTLENSVSNSRIKRAKAGILTALAFALGMGSCKPYVPPTEEPTNSAPTITSNPITSINEGKSYNYSVTATDPEGDKLTYSMKKGPSWLSISPSNGLVSGTAPSIDADTASNVEIDVSDGTNVAKQNYTLTEKNVAEDPSTPKITLETINLVEEVPKNISLPLTDKDGNTVSYTGASGTAFVGLSNNVLTLKSNHITQNENYSINVNFTDTKTGASGNATLEGLVQNVCDIEGKFINDKTGSTQGGILKLYDTNKNLLGKTSTSTDGTFSIQTSSPASQIILQAQDNNDGFISSLDLDGTRDYPNLIVGAMSKPTYCTKEEFRGLARGENISIGLIKSDVWNVGILRTNPITGDNLSNEDDFIINNKTKEWSNILISSGGQALTIYENPKEGTAYSVENGKINPKRGWAIVARDNSMKDLQNNPFYGGNTILYGSETPMVVGSALIRLSLVNDTTAGHEGGHVWVAQNGHSPEGFNPDYSLMLPNHVKLTSPGIAEKDLAPIIYRGTHLPKTSLDKNLGMNWMN